MKNDEKYEKNNKPDYEVPVLSDEAQKMLDGMDATFDDDEIINRVKPAS